MAICIKGEKLGPLKGYNNIGIQDKPLSIFYEGKALSIIMLLHILSKV
jgi:hypothetical protein